MLTEKLMFFPNSKGPSWLTLKEWFKYCGLSEQRLPLASQFDNYAAEQLHDQLESEAGGFYCGA